jgi:hypothetical protein
MCVINFGQQSVDKHTNRDGVIICIETLKSLDGSSPMLIDLRPVKSMVKLVVSIKSTGDCVSCGRNIFTSASSTPSCVICIKLIIKTKFNFKDETKHTHTCWTLNSYTCNDLWLHIIF